MFSYPPVFISDLHVIVKIVEMVKLSLEQRLVSEHGDDHVKTAEHSQSVSLELGGPDVVGVHAGEQGTGGGVLEEKSRTKSKMILKWSEKYNCHNICK